MFEINETYSLLVIKHKNSLDERDYMFFYGRQ